MIPLRNLRKLAAAARSDRNVRVWWRDTGHSSVARRVQVAALACDQGEWIAALVSAAGSAVRLLRLARVDRVELGRRAARIAQQCALDAVDFTVHRYLDPDAGPAKLIPVWFDGRLAVLGRMVFPMSHAQAAMFGGVTLHVRASRPEYVHALVDTLGHHARVDSASPMPRTTTKQGSSAEARLLKLATWLLSQKEPVTRSEIVEAFPDDYRGKASAVERKFTRDKDALRRLGYIVQPVEVGVDEGSTGYVIDARSCTLPKIEFTPAEAALVWTAGVGALRFSTHPLADELESALRKLIVGAKGLPPRATATEELRDQRDGHADPETLEKLADAWERRKRVTMTYWRIATDEVVERQVDVYGWARRRGEWIFVGRDHLRDAVRIFYLSRVRSLKVNPLGPQKPDYQVPDDFDIRRWSRQQVWEYDVHAPVAVVVRFRGALARLARQLLPTAQVTTDEGGYRVARLAVRNLRGLVRQALAWGPEAELVAPAEGRAMAREILAMLARSAEVSP